MLRIICCLSILISACVYARNDTTINNPFYIGFRNYYGFIIPHSESIRSISYSRPRGVGIDMGWLALDQKVWDHCFCYPMLGFNFYYTDFNNRPILGHAYAMLFFVEPTFAILKRAYLSYRFGMGIAYMDTPYDSLTNPKNLFYSTRISFPLQAAITLNISLYSRLKLRISANYEHISNGGLKQPNKGINYPTIGFGANYFIDQVYVPVRSRITNELYSKNWLFYATLSGTAKTIANNESTRYFIYGLTIEGKKRFARISAFSVGTELTVDYSLKEYLNRIQLDKDYKRAGVLIGHNLLIGRIVFYQKLGAYLYSPYKAKDPIYQRYGLMYRATKNIWAGVDLKAHRHVADFLDIRLSYCFFEAE
ncbi:MAG: acyloxyacyl hydrolase [Bacteroidales bacterium]|nr:acyloxyacyl hydrolase [Bacteroidales bacterium]